MSSKGFSHIGLSTHDLDKTRDFYENVLGFKAVRCDIIKIKEGGRIRHIFFEVGRDQLIAFMEPKDVKAIPADYDAGINEGLGVPGPFYHFAFEAGSVAALEAKRRNRQVSLSHRSLHSEPGQDSGLLRKRFGIQSGALRHHQD